MKGDRTNYGKMQNGEGKQLTLFLYGDQLAYVTEQAEVHGCSRQDILKALIAARVKRQKK